MRFGVLLVTALTGIAAAPPAARAQPVRGETTATTGATAAPDTGATVSLDVVVATERGERLEGLRPSDFTVTMAGKRVPLTSVTFVGPRPSDAVREPSGTDDGPRLFGIVLDEYHVAAGDAANRVRDALLRFVREDLRPGDQVAVLRPLDSVIAITLTTNHEEAAAAIERFHPRRGDYRATTAFEQEFIAGTPARIDATRAQIATSLVSALSMRLGRSPAGRKTLILVSDGFNPASARRRDALFPGVASIVAAANRAHVALYPLSPTPAGDPAPSDAGEAAREMLRSLAADTTGRFADASEPQAALRGALADASGYYVLTFPADGERDGRFHRVDVSVSRPRATVRARPGFWAASAVEQRLLKPVSEFLSPYSSRLARRTSVMIRPWFGMAPGEDGGTRVNFVWEPAPRVPGERTLTGVPVRVRLLVTTLDGEPVYDGVVVPATSSFSLPGTASRIAFPTTAKRLLVQMAIEDATTRVIDRDVRDLVVGTFGGGMTLGTAEILRARTARDRQTLGGEPLATPVASRTFSRSELLIIRVPVGAPPAGMVLTGRLVSAAGSVLREVPGSPMQERPGVYQFELPLASFASGAYRFDLLAHGGGADVRDSVPFKVTP